MTRTLDTGASAAQCRRMLLLMAALLSLLFATAPTAAAARAHGDDHDHERVLNALLAARRDRAAGGRPLLARRRAHGGMSWSNKDIDEDDDSRLTGHYEDWVNADGETCHVSACQWDPGSWSSAKRDEDCCGDPRNRDCAAGYSVTFVHDNCKGTDGKTRGGNQVSTCCVQKHWFVRFVTSVPFFAVLGLALFWWIGVCCNRRAKRKEQAAAEAAATHARAAMAAAPAAVHGGGVMMVPMAAGGAQGQPIQAQVISCVPLQLVPAAATAATVVPVAQVQAIAIK